MNSDQLFKKIDSYSDEEWLKKIRRWPPKPTKDLMNFIDLK